MGFTDWGGDGAEWSLFFVNERPGVAAGHTFYKYVLVCTSGTHSHKPWRKFQKVFSGRPATLFKKLGQVWDEWFKDAGNHFHVGVVGATAFSQYTDENEAEWKHLRPDLPAIHGERKESDALSDPESLTESEIFRRFAFENDEPVEAEWSVVKPKSKARDGCLPFCFDSNRNIFPDWNGVFRHYCRAEVLWQCPRKTCTRPVAPRPSPNSTQPPSTKTADGRFRTQWFSVCSWYHEHLKDKETQGLRKGFERQYCLECWKNSKEWVEGQICKFDAPGTSGGGQGKHGRHDREMCVVCQRLSEKNFNEGCAAFAKLVADGKVKVHPGSADWVYANGSHGLPRRAK